MHVSVAAIKFENASGDLVKHVPIVRDHDESAGVLRQCVFQETDGIKVEVVRGFVENETIPLTGEKLRQCNALGLTTGEFARVRFHHGTHAQLVEHCFALPTAAHCIAHGAWRQHGQLWQHPNSRVASAAHHTSIRFIFSRENAQQRALAAAVQADHSQSIAGAHGDRDVGEQCTSRTRGGEAFCVDEDHG